MSTFRRWLSTGFGLGLGACLYLANPLKARPVAGAALDGLPPLDREALGVKLETATLACG